VLEGKLLELEPLGDFFNELLGQFLVYGTPASHWRQRNALAKCLDAGNGKLKNPSGSRNHRKGILWALLEAGNRLPR
jgi:hypothetical protein